ncbi:MAG: hypothetical protein QNJ51_03020 [Calothrix sp. MO_167.B12]|nr:hypothetical protein [Calothrix sp. MO_167.B12]
MTTSNYCYSGETGEVSINENSVGSWDAPISSELIVQNEWNYTFNGIGAAGGCVTVYSVIYKESVDTIPEWAVDEWAYSGQPGSGFSGSCNFSINNLRAKVSFDGGQTYKPFQYVNGAAQSPPNSSNTSHYYPNGNPIIDLHGNSTENAYPQLVSKIQTTKYRLKIFSNGNEVFNQEYDSEPVISVSCSGIPHDCLNGACVLASEFGTPGLYKSLSACQKVCGTKGCSGVCLSKKEFSSLRELAKQNKRNNCG